VYRIVIGINCITSSLLLVLAYIGLQRMGLSRVQAFILSNLTALLPSGIYFAQFALADAVLPVTVLEAYSQSRSGFLKNTDIVGVSE
jgi:dolichyl-phosphate-mannose--protein O-mannosyl transferase